MEKYKKLVIYYFNLRRYVDASFWPIYDIKNLMGVRGVGEGGEFLGMVRPIGNIVNPLWVFLSSQYYDL